MGHIKERRQTHSIVPTAQSEYEMSALNILAGATSREEVTRRINDYILNSRHSGNGSLVLANIITEIFLEMQDVKNRLQKFNTEIDILSALREIRKHTEWNDLLDPDMEIPERAELKASDLWNSANGFYHLEWAGSGLPYRWTGPSPTFRFTSVLRRDQRSLVRLVVLHGGNQQKISKTICRIDGQPSQIIKQDSEGYSELFAVAEPQPNRRTITIEYEASSMDAAGSGDDRLLGLPVSSLTIEPANNEKINEIMNITPMTV